MKNAVDVLSSGAVILGDEVVCDGFSRSRPVRIQTHVHDDHMADFDTSKGFQNLFMSAETRELLIAEYNADLCVRENVLAIPLACRRKVHTCHVSLYPTGHMFGAVQVLVETVDGTRLGYSGDFRWPSDQNEVIRCDSLVVDSTYGHPDCIRMYTQQDAETCFLELLYSKLREGPVHLYAHRGTLHRAIQLMSVNIDAPLIGSASLVKEIEVYQRFGAIACEIIPVKSVQSKATIGTTRYVRLYSKGESLPIQLPNGMMITLSAFMVGPRSPVIKFSERAYRIAMSNHADFNGTLEYINATGAKHVVTNNTQQYGIDLALAIRDRLRIDARPSTNEHIYEWR